MAVRRGVLTSDQRDQLSCLARDRFSGCCARFTCPAGVVEGRWLFGGADRRVADVTDKTARLWPARYAESGIQGLRGIPHPGKTENA